MAACTPLEDVYDEIDAEGSEVVKTCNEYVLTEADYKSISKAAKVKAKTDAQKDLAAAVEKDLALNEFVTADEYIPTVLDKAFNSWGNGSNVLVTYQVRTEKSELEQKYASVQYHKVNTADYVEPNYGCYAPSAPADQELPKLLKVKFPDAAEQSKVLVDYREAAEEPKMEGDNLLVIEFEEVEVAEKDSPDIPVNLTGWSYYASNNNVKWVGKSYKNNKYMQISANRKSGACDTWAVMPAQQISKDMTLMFDVKYGFYNADCLSVLVSEKFNGSKFDETEWTELPLDDFKDYDKVEKPSSDYADNMQTISYSLKAYADKKLYVAFRYVGEGPKAKTTTCQIDNVKLSSLILKKVDARFNKLYVFNEGTWSKVADKDVWSLDIADYTVMGGNVAKYGNFSKAEDAYSYLPVLLDRTYPYAQKGDYKLMVYRVNKINNPLAVQFNRTADAWEAGAAFELKEDQNFIKNDNVWKFDPTITYAHTKDDLQRLVEWVRTNKPAYLDPKYPDNSEFWFGASAYYNNFNLSLDTRRGTDPDNLIDKKDDKLAKQYLLNQVAEACRMILQANFPNAPTTMNGLDLYYKVETLCYSNGAYTINSFRFKSEGNGNFVWDKNVDSRPQ